VVPSIERDCVGEPEDDGDAVWLLVRELDTLWVGVGTALDVADEDRVVLCVGERV